VPDTKPETARVDPAATRRRLVSFLGSQGYKPDLLARIARIAVELNETVQAGRYWLLSEATGPDVDAAVEAFAESCQRMPRLMVSELPRFRATGTSWRMRLRPEHGSRNTAWLPIWLAVRRAGRPASGTRR